MGGGTQRGEARGKAEPGSPQPAGPASPHRRHPPSSSPAAAALTGVVPPARPPQHPTTPGPGPALRGQDSGAGAHTHPPTHPPPPPASSAARAAPGRAGVSPQPRRASPVRPPPLPCPRRRWSKKKGLARSVTHRAPASSTSSGPNHIVAGPPTRRSGATRLGVAGAGPGRSGEAAQGGAAGPRRRVTGPRRRPRRPLAARPPHCSGAVPGCRRGAGARAAAPQGEGRRFEAPQGHLAVASSVGSWGSPPPSAEGGSPPLPLGGTLH